MVSLGSTYPIPHWLSRWNALVTCVFGVSVLAGAPPLLLALLVPDFVARAVNRREWSYVAWIGKRWVGPLLPEAWKGRMGRWEPKRFAAQIGTGFLAAVLCAYAIGHWTLLGRGLLVVLVLCAFLEAAFGLCVACSMFRVLSTYGWADECPEGKCEVSGIPPKEDA